QGVRGGVDHRRGPAAAVVAAGAGEQEQGEGAGRERSMRHHNRASGRERCQYLFTGGSMGSPARAGGPWQGGGSIRISVKWYESAWWGGGAPGAGDHQLWTLSSEKP